MLRKQNSTSKLISALGVFALVMAFLATKADAQGPVSAFSAAVYSGRYVCRMSSSFDFFTGTVKYNPNGAGKYTAGTLTAPGTNFGAPAGSFCSYTLDTKTSAYTVDAHGLGFETLNWTPSGSNDASCPAAVAPATTITDQTAIALRNLANANGVVFDAEVSDGNFLNQSANPAFPGEGSNAGHGSCLK
jgi:hypothetical protein